MSYLKNEEEVDTYIAEIFRRSMEHPAVGPKLKKAALKMRVDYTDPDTVMMVDMGSSQVLVGEAADEYPWDVALAMTADDGHKFWLGKLNFTVAMTKGKIRTKGPVTELLKLLPLAKPLFAQYEEILREDGRDDLLNVTR
ncbi:SCP2 sterol-binding domain-containing protein [Nitriliruptor alkaliphilus]|uniref:SCP2 sterol-binding domain-containing protein n=1 Tax=Nitriliruptor alkaliphilus TaxID=427918 RepID=UPI000697CD90|nr:SCP2 sterol-binding domain-containing protein [Nitriliruptor alkaliphilus]